MNTGFKNKNLLVIAHSYANFVKDQVEALSSYFNHIHVLVRHNPIADISDYVPINYLKPFRASSIIDPRGRPHNVSVIATNTIYLPTSSQYRKLGDKHFRVVDRVISEKNITFDLIHSHFTWTAGYVGAKLKEKYGVPFVLTVHENRDWFVKEHTSGYPGIYYTWKSADEIIRVNRADVPALEQFNSRVSSIPNGYAKDKFFRIGVGKARQLLGLPPYVKIILSVGQLVKRKGFDYLVDALGHIANAERDFLCLICGDGEQRNALGKRIRRLGLQEKVKLVGLIPHDKLYLWINACDVFVLPSLSESFGLVQIEAMACGKPVVATYNGGSEEIITSEDYGLLCKAADPDDLAEKVLMALEKEWDAEKIARYAEQFNWENVAKEVLKVYETAVGLS